ncbi:MAG: hypothetical protein K0S70_205 [Microbacterium sp.]|jgi:hypothetical protein|nr:hypothetical protein [Microbacterium sp.]
MSARSTVLRGRKRAEALMIDAVSVSRPTGAVNPITGQPTTSVVYTGKAKVQTYEAFEKQPEVGGGTVTVQRYTVHLPIATYVPRVGDVVTVTAAVLDSNLVGRRYVVQGLLHKSFATSYRLLVDDNNGFGGA